MPRTRTPEPVAPAPQITLKHTFVPNRYANLCLPAVIRLDLRPGDSLVVDLQYASGTSATTLYMSREDAEALRIELGKLLGVASVC